MTTATYNWKFAYVMHFPFGGDDELESQFETYFKSENGHFSFERVYTGMDNGQLRDWIAKGQIFNCERVSEYLLRSLHMHDCPYANVIAAIINLYTACSSGNPKYNKVSDFAATLRKTLPNVVEGIRYDEHIGDIGRAIENNDLIFLKVLVRYGALHPDKSVQTRGELHGCFNSVLRYIFWNANKSPLEPYFEHLDTVKERMFSLYNEILLNPNLKIKYLRWLIVMNVLRMLYRRGSSSDTVSECFDLYFEASPESFVTLREIQELTDIRPKPLDMFNEQKIEEGYKRLRSFFPDCDILQPRTLQHLCRCAIRTQLTERGVLPEEVAKLSIPDRIKTYILISKSGS